MKNMRIQMSKIGILEKLRNMRFVEENFDEINQDKFFKTDDGFEEIYYNPDSTAGGQLVYNEFPFDLILEALKQDDEESFYETIASRCKQCLVDIDAPEFLRCLLDFMERKPYYLGDTMETAKAMIEVANDGQIYHNETNT